MDRSNPERRRSMPGGNVRGSRMSVRDEAIRTANSIKFLAITAEKAQRSL